MNKHKFTRTVIMSGILLLGIFSVQGVRAQVQKYPRLQKYPTPDSINPLNINIGDFLAEDLGAIKIAADMAYRREDYLEAARNYLYMVNRNTDDPDSYYQIAACYSQMGMFDYAIDFLILAVNAGFVNFDMIANDKVFTGLRNNRATTSRLQELISYGAVYGETRYFEVTKLEKCLVFLPPGYDPERAYPLVIGLHGNGSNPHLFSDLWKDIRGEEVIFAVPQSPYAYSTRGGKLTQQYSWSIISQEEALWEKAYPLIIEYFAAIARGIRKDYKTVKTILFGFSQGAGFGYAGAIKHHDIFDGLICFGGRLPDPDEAPWFLNSGDLDANNDLKVFIAHGSADQAINVSEARRSNRILKKHAYTTKMVIFEGGHYVPGEVLRQGIGWILEEE